MSNVLSYDDVVDGMKRGFRLLELSYKGNHKTITMPGWYREGSDDGIHSEEDMVVSDKALAELKDKVASLSIGVITSEDDIIQVVEERLKVGKRAISRGRVRVHSYVVETLVSEDVTLRDETVSIDRRPVDRPIVVLEADAFQERTIELEEFAEEVVVSKKARVVEEIGIRKAASDRTETVRDTVRSSRVDIDDGRTMAGTIGGSAETIRDDMEVVGSDGLHVGTIDHLDGGRIKLKKADAVSGGEHHYLTHDMVQSIADKVMLAVTAAEAKARLAKA